MLQVAALNPRTNTQGLLPRWYKNGGLVKGTQHLCGLQLISIFRFAIPPSRRQRFKSPYSTVWLEHLHYKYRQVKPSTQKARSRTRAQDRKKSKRSSIFDVILVIDRLEYAIKSNRSHCKCDLYRCGGDHLQNHWLSPRQPMLPNLKLY